MLFELLIAVFLVASCVLAWQWGGLDERLAAAGFVAATLVSNFVNQSYYHDTEIGILLVDVALLLGLLALALLSDRFWPMWAAAFQLVGTTVHGASVFESGDFAKAYAVGLIFWTYPVIIALMVGTAIEARARRQWTRNAL